MSYNSKYTGAEVEALLDAANGKQDKIEDLDAIRAGAEAGATALQSIPSEYITESELEQKGYLTAVPSEYVTEDELAWTKAEGEAGVRLKGTNGTATGNLAISAGDDKTASDGTAFTSAASGDHAVVFGFGNTCAGRSTLAQGLYNIVNGKDSVAFGQRNTVNGDQAFAAGQQNEVTTRLGVTVGYQNKATNTNSIAIGYKNTSSGSGSVALGDTCESSGTSSTAMGYKTKATGAYSSTFGENTQATNNGEVAMGVYNKSTTSTDTSEQTAFSFGIGTSDTNRANAFEIKKNGDVYIGNELLSEYVTESELSAALADKVDKVTGKGLSTEDFTSALKNKLEGLTNYDDAEISNAVSSLQSQINTLVSGNANDAINSFNEIIAFLEGVKDTEDLASIIASIEQQIASKMDKVTLATVATSGSYNDLSNKPTIPSAVTESTVSGWGFTKNTGTYSKPSGGIPKTDLASAVQTSLGKADTALQSYTEQYKGTVTGVKINGTTKNPSNGVVDLGTVLTSHQDISSKQDKLVSGTNIKTINGQTLLGGGDITIEGGGSSNDIYVFVVEDEYGTITEEEFNAIRSAKIVNINIEQGFDIVSVVKLDLSEAGFGVVLTGTINIDSSRTSITVNIQNDLTYRVNYVEEIIPTSTSQLENDSNFITSDGLKTINGQSLVGSGNITISGGGGSSSGGGAYGQVNHGTSDTTFTLTPNTFHVWDEVTSLTLTLGSEQSGVANEYVFQFTSGSTPTSLTLPDDIRWVNDSAPTIANNMIYQISVLNGLAVALEFINNTQTIITFNVEGTTSTAVQGMTWKDWKGSEYDNIGYLAVLDNEVVHGYTRESLYSTINGSKVKGIDIIEPVTYSFTNPFA